jgi:transposase-like protein
MAHLKLTVEPVPPSSAYASLANLLPRELWDRLRREAYRRAGYRCQACKRSTRLHCHEVWSFNDRTECQTLLGFEALCEDCHRVKHIFPIRKRAEYIRSLRHLVAVNGFSADELTRYMQAAFRQYVERSKTQWKVTFGSYAFLVPSLRDKAQRVQFVRKTHLVQAGAGRPDARADQEFFRAPTWDD